MSEHEIRRISGRGMRFSWRVEPAITAVRLHSWRARISNLLRRVFGEE